MKAAHISCHHTPTQNRPLSALAPVMLSPPLLLPTSRLEKTRWKHYALHQSTQHMSYKTSAPSAVSFRAKRLSNTSLPHPLIINREKSKKYMLKSGIYKHFKGNEYKVLYIAKHSETMEEMVVYQALYGERSYWVRPLHMFTERVEKENYKGPRFVWVTEKE
jgi:hypothetical protein